MKIRLMPVFLALAAAIAFAQPPTELEDFSDVRPARVGPRGAALFHCPHEEETCRDPVSLRLPAGRVVFVHPERDGFLPLAVHDSGRFVHPADIGSFMPFDLHPSARAWFGHWAKRSNHIRIAPDRNGGFEIDGEATWKGPFTERYGGFHATVASPRGNLLLIEDDDCRIRLGLYGSRLIAADNQRCGGVNVRFWDEYRSAPGR